MNSVDNMLCCLHSTKNTILKKYDGRFKDIFQEIYEKYEKHSLFTGKNCSLAKNTAFMHCIT